MDEPRFLAKQSTADQSPRSPTCSDAPCCGSSSTDVSSARDPTLRRLIPGFDPYPGALAAVIRHPPRWHESFMDTAIVGQETTWRSHHLTHVNRGSAARSKLVRGSEVGASTVIFDLIRQDGMSSSDVLIVFCLGSQTSA